jgi:hypothetical protein
MACFIPKPAPVRRKKSTPPQPHKNLVAAIREKKKLECMDSYAGKLKIGIVKFPAINNQPKESLPVPAFINNPFAPTADEVFTSLDYLLKL